MNRALRLNLASKAALGALVGIFFPASAAKCHGTQLRTRMSSSVVFPDPGNALDAMHLHCPEGPIRATSVPGL